MTISIFFKRNFALITGLSLPVLLVFGFLLANNLPQMKSNPPQYEMVFSVTRYDNHSSFHVDFTIRNQKLYMRLTPKKEHESGNVRDLFIYNGQKESVRKIDYLPLLAQSVDFENEIPVEALRDYSIDSNSKAPDGYEFEYGGYRSRGLLGEIFGGRRHVNRVKKKDGGSFVMPDYGNGYSYGGISFIGWIVNSE
ncbi:MAG: hypothetical protein KDF59_08460 [Nitrosomonas sp.]|nr:hypothetical protein [Nitrosomonas sp.]